MERTERPLLKGEPYRRNGFNVRLLTGPRHGGRTRRCV